MAIDNRLDQARAMIENERRAQNPIMERLETVGLSASVLSKFFAALGLATVDPVNAMAEIAEAAKDAREMLEAKSVEYFVAIMEEDLRDLRGQVETLPDQHRRFLIDAFPFLWLEAERLCRITRARDRVERIATILGSSVLSWPALDADETEELMRVAQSLDDRDVLVLGALHQEQSDIFVASEGRVPPERANDKWMSVQKSVLPDFSTGERESRYSKLQSFGLIVQAERNQFKVGAQVNVYVILARAMKFIDAIRKSSRAPV